MINSKWLDDTYDAYQSRVLIDKFNVNKECYYVYRCSNLGGEVDYHVTKRF